MIIKPQYIYYIRDRETGRIVFFSCRGCRNMGIINRREIVTKERIIVINNSGFYCFMFTEIRIGE